MAKRGATTPVQEEPKQENTTVQETEVTETPQGGEQDTPVQEEPKQENVKVYKFTSTNPYLTVADLGIQFRQGKAETSNLNVAKALAKVGGVELVEE